MVNEEHRARAGVETISDIWFQGIFEATPRGILLYKLTSGGDLLLIGGNPAADALFGMGVATLKGLTIEKAFPQLADTEVPEQFKRIAAEGGIWKVDEFRYNDGTISGIYDFQAFQTLPNHLVVIFGDISDRKRASAALAASERRYRQLFEAMNEGFALHEIICDEAGNPRDYRFLEVNPAFEQLTGLKGEDIVGKTVLEVLPHIEPVWIERYGRVALSGAPVRFENYSHELDRYYEVLAYCPEPGQFAALFLDVTERRKAEEEHRILQAQIQHAQKLESLGVLAGGIAHDFNNLLVGVLGNADLALSDLSPVSPARKTVEEIRKAAVRASDLTRQMLAYSGKGRFVVMALDLNELVEEMAHLLKVSVSKKAVLKLDFAKNLPYIEADATQIRQIVMNLITNASDAIGERSGTITVRTSTVDADSDYLDSTFINEDLPEGRYVCLEVSDTGCGMSPEMQARMFDPFFSTKFSGRGLGLAAVLGIVRGHKGAIKVYSEEDRGTSFKLLLPCSGREVLNKDDCASGSDHPSEAMHGLVLVADDEPIVRTVSRRMLEAQGFDVLVAADGREALDIFHANADKIVLVLLDMTMPRVSGEEAFREMRRMKPDIKVILCSGYNEQDATNRFVGKGLAGFLQKPFPMDMMLKCVRDVLSAQSANQPVPRG